MVHYGTSGCFYQREDTVTFSPHKLNMLGIRAESLSESSSTSVILPVLIGEKKGELFLLVKVMKYQSKDKEMKQLVLDSFISCIS